MDVLQVGLIGLGTVGSGVARIISDKAAWLEKRAGMPVRLKRVAELDLRRKEGLPLGEATVSTQVEDILEDPDISVVIELIGGIEPAKTFLLSAMSRKKHVITANKALISSHGQEIFQHALKQQVEIGFEAAVAGGIPLIRSFKEGLAVDRMLSIAGIINGTANYILSSMTEKGLEFSECLQEAQAHGYAEADPTLDIEGQDTAHKLAILVALAYGKQIHPQDIYTEGIVRITGMDIRYALELGYRIKLLALAKIHEGKLEVRVHPTMIPSSHMLAMVGQAFNAVYVVAEDTGPVMFYGKGAGMMPTGSAVVSDLVAIARNIRSGAPARLPPLGFYSSSVQDIALQKMEDLVAKYYIRFPAMDRPGVLSKISGALGEHGISIHSVIQHGRQEKGPVNVIMLTHEAREQDLLKALAVVDGLEVILDRSLYIRIEDSFDPVPSE